MVIFYRRQKDNSSNNNISSFINSQTDVKELTKITNMVNNGYFEFYINNNKIT